MKTEEYEAMKKDGFLFDIKIQSYPMNTRLHLVVETNFGEISYGFDYPPHAENRLGELLQNCYEALLGELYAAHEARGGKFIGEDGCRVWFDENGRTVIKKEGPRHKACK